ncbi:whirlin-like [Clavelina lepadiformis]|uniref:whirlin-like n=1 Tax=Clavelina lepadiformis TaxID=159417 RepID=UPI004041626B
MSIKMAFYKTTSTWSSQNPSTSSDQGSYKRAVNVNVYNLQTALRKLLTKEEQDDVTHILSCYHVNRNVYYLAESIKSILDTQKKKALIPLLKQVIPAADRPGFDQFTCESTYISKTPPRRGSNISHQRTVDSGIGSSSAGRSEIQTSYQSNRPYNPPPPRPHRSSSLSDLSRNSSEKSFKRFSAGNFGSAVRRKVKAVLTRRGSSSSVELKSSIQRRHGSESQLHKVGKSIGGGGDYMQNNGFTSGSETLSHAGKTAQDDVIYIKLRQNKHQELGFMIGGGAEVGTDIFVSQVDHNSAASKAGLREGDVLVKVNNTALNSRISHEKAAAVLKSKSNLVLHVKPSGVQDFMLNRRSLSWMDMHGRPASPPREKNSNDPASKTPLDNKRSSLRLLSAGERKVQMVVKPKQSLGLMIRGGSEYGLGVYVTGVDDNSAAENAGLKPGDEILEVNGIHLEGATHAEVVKIIKSSRILIMTVRYVGRIPQNQLIAPRMMDDRLSVFSSATGKATINMSAERVKQNGVRSTFQRKMMSTKQMILPNMHARSPTHLAAAKISSMMATLEESLLASPVWMALTDSARHTLRYYVREYTTGHVTPDGLVLALSEILDNTEKFSLTSAVRECIMEKDLDRFDVLVLRREIDALKNQNQQPSCSDSNSLGTKSMNSSLKSEDNSTLDPVASIQPSPVNGLPGTGPKHVEENDSCQIDLHSTPNESFANHSLTNGSKISPVKPTQGPPPPPPAAFAKTSPVKPKRSSLIKPITKTDETKDGDQEFTPVEKDVGVTSNSNPGTPLSDEEERCQSPFSFALEKHRSSNSGRIKAANKTHAPMPEAEFFQEPQEQKQNDSPPSPVYAAVIKPVRNPSIKFKKKAQSNTTFTAFIPQDLSKNLEEIPPPSSETVSSSSSLNESSESLVPPPLKITLRPTTFGSYINEKIKNTHCYPIKVDVHQNPSVKDTTHKLFKPKPPSTPKEKYWPYCNTKLERFDTEDSSDENDSSKHPCLDEDVETQKVVIFRTATTLGLTIEGGAGTKQPLPRVLSVQPGSCAQMCGRIKLGHVIHEVNGKKLNGMNHKNVVRTIAIAFKEKNRDSIELILSGPYY